jgi:hypothetical protein
MRLKKTLLATLALMAGATVAAGIQGNFCDGYKDGYRQGYTQVAGAGPPPLTPMCPGKIEKKDDDNRSEYDRGFQRGLKDGLRDAAR